MTLIEYICVVGFFGFLALQFLVLLMIFMLDRRIKRLENEDRRYDNPVYG